MEYKYPHLCSPITIHVSAGTYQCTFGYVFF